MRKIGLPNYISTLYVFCICADGPLKVHKIENFFDSDFRICIISLLVMSKYSDFTKENF
jgi:hypothetical protein